MTTRARAFYLLKNRKKIGKLDNGHPTFIRIFKIRFHSSILNTIRRFYKSNVGKSWNDGFPSIYGSQMSSLRQSRSKAHELIETMWLLAFVYGQSSEWILKKQIHSQIDFKSRGNKQYARLGVPKKAKFIFVTRPPKSSFLCM